jgi:hypothetical protein
MRSGETAMETPDAHAHTHQGRRYERARGMTDERQRVPSFEAAARIPVVDSDRTPRANPLTI